MLNDEQLTNGKYFVYIPVGAPGFDRNYKIACLVFACEHKQLQLGNWRAALFADVSQTFITLYNVHITAYRKLSEQFS